MSRRHPIRRYRPGLDEDQTRDAMKVLEKFVRKKYRNSVLVGTNEYDLNSELLTPQPPPSRPVSGFQFPRFPSRQFTFDQSTVGQESRPPLVPTYTFDFTEHSVKDEIKYDKSKETKAAYISRVIQYFYNNLGLKHLALILILILYALIGGLIFMLIELPEQERMEKEFLKDSRQRHSQLASFLLQSLYSSGCLKELRTRQDSETQIVHENSLCAITLRPLLQSYDESIRKMLAPHVQWKWDYWNSVYYAGTIFTTIGYGNITCRTPTGRLLTILYALFGIPMMLAVLNVIGKALFGHAQASYMFVRRRFRRRLRQFKKSRGMNRAGTIDTLTTDDVHADTKPNVEEVDPSTADDSGLFETFPMSLAILLVRWENQYMWALQLIDQEHQELMDHQEAIEEHEKEDKDKKSTADNASSIRWRSTRRDSSDSDDETRTEDLSSADRNRCSTVLLDSKDLPVIPPPVLGVFLSRTISTRQKGKLTRSESTLSRRVSRSPWLSVSTEQSISPGPSGPRSASSATSLVQRGPTGHKLSAINEVSDEDTLQSRRGSSLKKLQRLEAVEIETPQTPVVTIEGDGSGQFWGGELDATETTPLSPQDEENSASTSQGSGSSRRPKPPTSLNLRYKAAPDNK
ncbi:Ion channel [Ancylostoma ceylanicum]|uniref:Ion channel n=1 Tax=Ancylostoma ceylanicum TaxID=53326 RepID=A0A0D6MA43_9BILA|nr:Ion channel [Ancylostoma ceylanicum]